jgi:polyisoprenoid-binding protein YceI
MKILKIYVLFLLPLFAFTAKTGSIFPPENKKIVADKVASWVSYSMNHPMHSWEGVCKDVNAAILIDSKTKVISQVAVALKVDSFNSGNGNRDSHGLEVMEALKYPKVTFVSNKIKASAEVLTIEGNLTFHGVSKPITIVASQENFTNKVVVEGKFELSLTDFKVERPSLFGVKTDDKMSMKFKVVFAL